MAESSTTQNQIDAKRQSIDFFLELKCSSLLTERFKCSVCLDVFTNPVTIPCGHNFCKRCLNQFWEKSENCLCPFCKKTFNNRPDLKVNTTLTQIMQFVNNKFDLTKSVQISDKVLCDYCDEQKLKALKSCLTCQISYCGTHLEPHRRVPQLKKRKLINAVKNLEDFICQKHERPLELFCRDDKTCVCLSCTDGDHKNHNTVPLEEESVVKKIQLIKKKTDVQKMIQDRMKKIEEIRHSAELRKLLETIEQKEQIEVLEKEITELKTRDGKLENLSQTEDPLNFLQIYSSLCTLSREQWPESSDPVSLNTIRTDLAQMQTLDDKVTETELNRMCSHAVDVTLDPDTAHPQLILSADGKQVSCGNIKRDVPDNPKRFDCHVFVLGKEGFSSGKFYFEVQVTNKTKWGLGVFRESAMRKGDLLQNPQNGYWAICLRKGNEYWALTQSNLLLSLKVKPQKVGVFVDYQEGLVFFYEVESKSHIYRFTGINFTEKLYPYFCPSQNEDGNNAEPLIISTVKYNTVC